VADRFTNPDTAEEATALAAAESEDGVSIDESVQEEQVITAAVEETAAQTEDVAKAENLD
jgi:hypothetical protein